MIDFAHKQRTCSEALNCRNLERVFADRQYGPVPEAWEPRALRVLVVEDDADTAECMARLVRFWGHDVRQANSAEAGLKEAVNYRPDFVLLDVGMPTMDGCVLTRRLRSNPHLQGCFIAAVTGYGDADQRRRCFDAGIDLFLVKPVNLSVLEKLLKLESDSSDHQEAHGGRGL